MARLPGKRVKPNQDDRVMIAARMDRELVKEMKKYAIDADITYQQVLERAVQEFLSHTKKDQQ